ncbi:hypothetical protein [Paraburkholderia youngii]|uniref:NADH dehydrogenase FAD-containing subunit n=1 Tax=Paraburkholderia youngii TaxID=2782701 RepID=A0A7W8L861_9BURK|nr:hypothetical protein [Paraburkholderia youngii]MBB5402292.1 NADH dehydrogenase FAD-containing subunit [Paraburkholderia youngii]
MNTAAERNTFHRVMIVSAGGTGLALATHVARQFVAADARFRLVDRDQHAAHRRRIRAARRIRPVRAGPFYL